VRDVCELIEALERDIEKLKAENKRLREALAGKCETCAGTGKISAPNMVFTNS